MNRLLQWYRTNALTDQQDERLFWRERILSAVLLGSAGLGLVAYVTNLITAFQHRTWGWAAIYTVAIVLVLSVAFFRRLAYPLRAGVFLAILYGLGIVSAMQFGSAGDARIWLIGFSVLAGVFLGARIGAYATLLSFISLLTVGILMSQGILAAPAFAEILLPSNFASWLTTAIPFLAVGMIIVASGGVLINGLNASIQRRRELTAELEADRTQLEQRTQALERREVQVRTAADISRAISAQLDPDAIFQRVVNLLEERFNLYYAGVFVLDESGRYAVLRAGTGDAGASMLAAGHRLAVGGSSMVGWATANRTARIALDVGAEAVRFDNPHLPLTRSELALPMISGNRVLGALTIQSDAAEAFDQDDVIVYQSIADSLATALDNANLFQQAQASLEEIRSLHRQYLAQAWAELTTRQEDLEFAYENPATKHARETPIEGLPSSSVLEIPLVLRDQVIGNLTLEAARPGWTPIDQAFIEAVTTQAALALENARLVAETQRSAQHDRIVADIVSRVWASPDIDAILRTTAQQLGQALQASEVLISIEAPSTTASPQGDD